MDWIPVSTTAAVKELHPHLMSLVEAPQPGTTYKLTDVRVSNQQISVSYGGKLQIGTIFNTVATSDEVGYWLEAMAYTDQYEHMPDEDGDLVANRFGVGLRILFRVKTMNANANLNLAFLGASLDMGYVSGVYEIIGVGIGAQALPMILSGMSQSGLLNGESLYRLNTAVMKNLVEYLKKHVRELRPQRIAALIYRQKSEASLGISQAIVFAMRQISAGRSLEEAIERAGDLDLATITLIYDKNLGSSEPTVKPKPSQRQVANDWLADN